MGVATPAHAADSSHPTSLAGRPLVDSDRATALALIGLMVATFVSRLVVGLHTGLDADEASAGISALEILHGRLLLVEPQVHYLGALEDYLMTPAIAMLGPTVPAIRLTTAVLGCAYVLALFDLGRALFRSRSRGILLAYVGAIFPFFALTWTVKTREYVEVIIAGALCLSLATRIGWHAGGNRPRNWALLGLAAGLGMWNDVGLLPLLLVVAVALLARAPRIGWRRGIRNLLTASLPMAVLGFSPWLTYNLTHGFASLRNLPSYSTSLAHGVRGFLVQELPIFVGTSSECGHDTVPAWVAWIGVGALAGATLWIRRRALGRLLRGDLASLEAVDMVLAVGVVAVAAVLAPRFNDVPCEPRYLLPLAIPMALAAALVLLRWRRWRPGAAALIAGYMAMVAITGFGPSVDSVSATSSGARIPGDQARVIADLERRGDTLLYGDYWLARPLTYLSDQRVDVIPYNGPSDGFPQLEARVNDSPNPGWLFVTGDPRAGAFQALMRSRGITATETSLDGYDLFTNLSAPLRRADWSGAGG